MVAPRSVTNTKGTIMKSTLLFLLVLLLAQISLPTAVAQYRSDSLLQNAPARVQVRANPYGGSDEARLAGMKLFRRHCADCHGEGGIGNSDAPSLQAHTVRSASPGALFWFLKNGNLRAGMPSWSRLPDPQLWQIVTYLNELRNAPQ